MPTDATAFDNGTPAVHDDDEGIVYADATIASLDRLVYASSEALVSGSTAAYAEFQPFLNEAATDLGATLDAPIILGHLQTDLANAQDSHDQWSALFNASFDLLGAGVKAMRAEAIAVGAEGFVEGFLTEAAVGATLGAASAPFLVPAAGLAAIVGATFALDWFWAKQLKPWAVSTYEAQVAPPASGRTVTGRAEDGPIAGATVFIDSNYNGRLDPGELATTTDASGDYALPNANGQIILTGGTDTTTGQPFSGTMILHDGQTVATPLTSLASMLRADGDMYAQSSIENAFSLSLGINLTSFDPVSQVMAGNPLAPAVFAAGAEVAVTEELLTSLLEHSTSREIAQFAAQEIIGVQIGRQVFTPQTGEPPGLRLGLDIVGNAGGNPEGTSTLISLLAQILPGSIASQTSSTIANNIASFNTSIEQVLMSGVTGAGLIDAVGSIEEQANGVAAALGPSRPYDFDGNGTADVLLEDGSGDVIDWTVQGGSYAGYKLIGSANGYTVLGSGNFNGDASGDVLFQGPGGVVADWTVQNGSFQSGAVLGNSNGYTVVGTGDFNGDGTSDVLFNNASGSVAEWLVSNNAVQSGSVVGYANGYGVIGSGDFNGDGTSDVLLENGYGSVIDWMMQGGAYQSYNVVGSALDYGVVGKGDFNGDGTTDILLENASGNVIDWLMQNGQYAGWSEVGNAAGYGIVATGDYNADGTTDVLLENANHDVIDWTMQNGTFSGWNNVGNAGSYSVKGV